MCGPVSPPIWIERMADLTEERLMSVQEIATWLSCPDSDAFPYDAVLNEYLRVGKHFVATELLEALARVRSALRGVRGPAPSVRRLDQFLDAALDKSDGRYDYVTYLALGLLPLAAADDPSQDTASAEWQCDRLVVQLVSDALRFELAAADGCTELLPQIRPDARTTSKRCRLGLQAVGPALRRLGLDKGLAATDPVVAARQVCVDVDADLSSAERRTLQLSMLPVYTVHDEWMFIRVLQSFETTFALLAVQLRGAMTALAEGPPALAVRRIREAEAALREAAPLFSLLATMQVDAFRTFRTYTEGASAIQSRNYKIVESLCRTPDRSRLDSIAYHSVPEVRERVLAGPATLDGAFETACAAGRLTSGERNALDRAMRQFAATLVQWRQTHYRIAVRMLGKRTGTGYTEGTPYLERVRTIPVFRSTDAVEGAGTQDLPKDEEVAHALSRSANPSDDHEAI